MARRVALTNLNGRTIDILNVIRQNASYAYQSQVPEVSTTQDIISVGDVLMGVPALQNEFLNALINRIALVRVKSALFNNPYSNLKKGYLEFGETVEEVFVNIAKAVEFSPEKAEAREFKRTIPDVKSAFHVMNWRVVYPVTIQDDDLRRAFMSIDGVTDLIAKIVESVYTAAEYDEYLLFKYMLIKAIAHGKMYPKAVDVDSDIKIAAKEFRSMSNLLPFICTKFNASGVHTTTPKANQYIFMDADFNAQFDVNVLASAFNMDKAEFMGKLHLIDDWTSFDSDRFDIIRANSTQIEAITSDELALMKDVIAVIVDDEWFQVYDNNIKFTEKYVASGLYWNYFLHNWKTVSSSPFSNAVVFVNANSVKIDAPESITLTVKDVVSSADYTIVTLVPTDPTLFAGGNVNFVETEAAVQNGVAVHQYGAYIFQSNSNAVVVVANVGGKTFSSGASTLGKTADVGDTITLTNTTDISNRLSNITFTSANITLTPTFTKDTLTYTGSYSYASSTASTTVTVTKEDSDATVKIIQGESTEITSGGTATLAEGENVFTIKCTGSTGTRTYKVTITYTDISE